MRHRLLVYIGAAVLVACVCIGCRRPAASASSVANGKDTASVEDILVDQQSAGEADRVVTAYVKGSAERWTQHDFGWWYRYTNKSDSHVEYVGLPTTEDTCCLIRETVYDLDGTFMADAIREFDGNAIGKRREPFAYQMMMREMVPGDTVIMLVPWPMAYSKRGCDYIPPCTNIRVRLTIHAGPYNDVELIEDTIVNTVL